MTETSNPPNDGRALKPRPAARAINSMEQAAILMLSMGDDISAGVLKHLTREEIIGISQAMEGTKMPAGSTLPRSSHSCAARCACGAGGCCPRKPRYNRC